ncbi:beta-Ig-H3/fasciclin [Plectosphaerella plurivora]|uniref:Beta-Ig-H3/fasciclin n=1 Tax=Plectosphaerella plurivora TaxID=936078 RepID=A0A9P8VBL8_9PEZI|nr:beta-Ig-H3/fasciclin [Plectosphaerella plurivora]
MALAAVASAQQLTQLLAQTNELSTLNSLLGQNPAITQMLAQMRDITILAPNNRAFENFMRANPGAAQNPQAVTPLLQYHVIQGTVMSNQLTRQPVFATTMLRQPFANVTGGQKVELSLMDGRQGMAVSGFKKMSMITKADVRFDGGVVHIVDTVLTMPASISRTSVDMGWTSTAGALTRTGLVGPVDSANDLTIFVPNNAAFMRIGGTAQMLQPQQLAGILQYHAVGGQVLTSRDIQQAMATGGSVTIRSLTGAPITVTMQNGRMFVNSARVVMADVLTSNGVIHVLDNVLNPAAAQAQPNPAQATQSPVFNGAQGSSNAPFTEGINPTTTIVPARNTINAGAYGAVPTAAVMGLMGGAAILANI